MPRLEQNATRMRPGLRILLATVLDNVRGGINLVPPRAAD